MMAGMMADTDLRNSRQIRAAVEQFLLRPLQGDAVTVSRIAQEYPAVGNALIEPLRERGRGESRFAG